MAGFRTSNNDFNVLPPSHQGSAPFCTGVTVGSSVLTRQQGYPPFVCPPPSPRGATGASSRSSQSPNSAVSRQPPGAAPGDKSKVRKKSGGCMGGSLGGMRQSRPPPGGWWAGWFPSSPGLAQWLRNQVYSEGTGSGNSGGNPPIKKQEFTTNMKAAPYKAGGSC